jgi:hypothetical protein
VVGSGSLKFGGMTPVAHLTQDAGIETTARDTDYNARKAHCCEQYFTGTCH